MYQFILLSLLFYSRADSVSTPASITDRELFDVYQDMRLSQLLSRGLDSRASTGLSQFASPGSLKVSVSEPPPRRYYKLFINETFFFKIWLDRLALLALLDRYDKSCKIHLF